MAGCVFVAGGSDLSCGRKSAGLGVNLRSIFASCGISSEIFDRGIEEVESVITELFRE